MRLMNSQISVANLMTMHLSLSPARPPVHESTEMHRDSLSYFRSLGIGHVDVVAEVVCLYGHVFA